MIFRNFRQVSTRQWLDVLMTTEGTYFPDTHLADIARGWKIPEFDLEVVDGSSDQRTGGLLPGPVPPPAGPTRRERYNAAGSLAAKVEILAELLERGP